MKHILITTIAAVLVVGCGGPQPPEPPKVKAPRFKSLGTAAQDGDIEAVKQHIAAGTDVNARPNSTVGWTPLHLAANRGQKETAKLLIAAGADVNAKDYLRGRTPLDAAIGNSPSGGDMTPQDVAKSREHKEVVELLIAKGADVNAKDEDGFTPLNAAKVKGLKEIADVLRKHGGKTGEELKAEGK